MTQPILTEISSHSPSDTFRLGRRLGEAITQSSAVGLTGDLGAGKTLLTKGLCSGLGVREHERVNSPTFVIMQEYQGRLRIRHYDTYRLSGSEDLLGFGLDEHFSDTGSVVVVEWADRVLDLLPPETLFITLEHGGGTMSCDSGVVDSSSVVDRSASVDKAHNTPIELCRFVTFRGDPDVWADKVRGLEAPEES